MKILLTNDDGIDAPGLALLAQVVAAFADPVIVAPLAEMSECGHRVTTKHDLVLDQRGENRFALDGTPADCVRIGLLHVCPDATWCLSGVNNGANLGVDTFQSGTVAAAREAALMGRSAVALSQFRRGPDPLPWPETTPYLRLALNACFDRPPKPGSFWNINFPANQDFGPQTDLVECPLDQHPLPVEYDVEANRYRYCAEYALRSSTAGTDIDRCFAGQITMSRIPLFGNSDATTHRVPHDP